MKSPFWQHEIIRLSKSSPVDSINKICEKFFRSSIPFLEKGCANYFWNVTNSGKLQRTAQVNKTDLCSNWLLEIHHSDWPRKHRWRLHNMIKRRRPSKDFWNYLCAEENWLPKVKNGVQSFISRYYIREWLNKTNSSKIT